MNLEQTQIGRRWIGHSCSIASSVCRCVGSRARADVAARTASFSTKKLLAEAVGKLLHDQPSHQVVRAAGCETEGLSKRSGVKLFYRRGSLHAGHSRRTFRHFRLKRRWPDKCFFHACRSYLAGLEDFGIFKRPLQDCSCPPSDPARCACRDQTVMSIVRR